MGLIRRVATLEQRLPEIDSFIAIDFERRYATAAFWPQFRGLKPTATFGSALRAYIGTEQEPAHLS